MSRQCPRCIILDNDQLLDTYISDGPSRTPSFCPLSFSRSIGSVKQKLWQTMSETLSVASEANVKAKTIKQEWQEFKGAFTSIAGFKKFAILENSSRLANKDLRPVPEQNRTWAWWNFFAYWFSESWAVSTWSLGSSMVSGGMTVKASILVFFFANVFLVFFIVLNARAASMYGIGFSVLARTSFGIYGHYFQVVVRSILGIIWGGVQLYYEGQFISIMFRCIFTSWWTLPNHIPASQYTDTKTMVAFFLAFLITIPFTALPTHKLKHIFSIKCVLMPMAGMGVVIWTCTRNGGVDTGILVEPAAMSQTAFAFYVLSQCNSIWGATSALVVTSPDLTRFSKTPSAQIYGNMLALPVAQLICGCFGILSTAAVYEMWGTAYWNPYDLLNAILDHHYNSKARAGIFFAAFSFFFATLGTSLACNIMPFAMDMSCIAPKVINTVRGQLLCLVVAFAIVPWRIVSTSNGFLTFMSGYSIFQGSVVGVMIVDYFMRKGNINLNDCYRTSRSGSYYYFYGINIRAFFAFIAGFVVPLPGFIGTFGTTSVSTAATYINDMGWLMSLLFGIVAYFIACVIFPLPNVDKSAPFESYVNHQPVEDLSLSSGKSDIEAQEKEGATFGVVEV
ncbi:unnamed protein product [Kuraishia capsulata CBS 1993]|uniref:Uracil permease n=1 Tax=Kuraishia capsulata CBS 1993 TaxID=1382522 RepID=W6MND6_9ASCO|nr:uncharacterized protein KUCA_T00002504001 [Kuraishia capsulata CBS 1993]CDK26532.1 unnamed protein product [Kuraishia capsulata CBS 1993]